MSRGGVYLNLHNMQKLCCIFSLLSPPSVCFLELQRRELEALQVSWWNMSQFLFWKCLKCSFMVPQSAHLWLFMSAIWKCGEVKIIYNICNFIFCAKMWKIVFNSKSFWIYNVSCVGKRTKVRRWYFVSLTAWRLGHQSSEVETGNFNFSEIFFCLFVLTILLFVGAIKWWGQNRR